MADQNTAGAAGTTTAAAATAATGTGEGTNTGTTTTAKPGDAGTKTGEAGAGTATGTGAAAADGAAKTILAEGGTEKTATTPASWPADWRAQALKDAGIAADDKAALSLLERLTSPGDLAKKVIEQEKLIRQGGHKAAFPKEGTPEAQAAWRKDNGIPDAPEKYDLTLPDGLQIGEADKPIVNNMLATMHAANLSNDTVKQIMASYYSQEKQFLVERDAEIATKKTEQDDALHKEWGNEYRPNLNAVSAVVKTFSEDTRNALIQAMDSDGFPLLNNRHFLKDLAVIARTINPIDHVPIKEGSDQMSSVADEIKAIEARMGGLDPTYYKDEAAQKRYLQLVEWRDSRKKTA